MQVCKEHVVELKTQLFLSLHTFQHNAAARILINCDELLLTHTLLPKLEQVPILQLIPKILAQLIHRSLVN